MADQRTNSGKPFFSIPNLTSTTTYGSGSLKATNAMTPKIYYDSADLVARGDSESCSKDGDADGIHNNNDIVSDGNYYNSCCGTWKEYFASWRFAELVVCVLPFLVAGIWFDTALIIPKMRPMPFQKVYTDHGTDGEIRSNVDESFTNIVWNPTFSEKNVGETVSHRQYQILMGLCPWLLQLLLILFLEYRKRNIRGLVDYFHRWDALHRTTCMYFVGIGATDFITNCVKFYVGYLRPVFLDFCKPYYNETASTFYCAEEDFDTLNARVSFPSNHSSWSFCGMMLLSMYLERCFGQSSIRCEIAKERIRQQRDRESFYRLVSLLCYSPMLIAFFVAASRVVDNRHFPADVVAGSVLGASVASLVFGIWFPQQSAL